MIDAGKMGASVAWVGKISAYLPTQATEAPIIYEEKLHLMASSRHLAELKPKENAAQMLAPYHDANH